MVEGMSLVLNVMLSLMSVISPPPALCNLSARTVVKLYTFGCFSFRGELGFLNCDDICMCVVIIKQFQLFELFWIPFMLTSSMMDFSHFYCWVCVLVVCL